MRGEEERRSDCTDLRGEERMGEEKRGEERRDMGRRGMWKGFDAVVIEKSYKVKTLSQERD